MRSAWGVSGSGADEQFRVVEDVVQAALELFLEVQPRTIVLTGGATPRKFYERLARISYPWEDVEAFVSDERCVTTDDERSNWRMISDALLSKVPATGYPIDGGACDAAAYERTLRDRFGDRPWFDLQVYGLGFDGHTASLFPGRPELEEFDRWVVRVPKARCDPFVPRVSLTLPILSATSVGVFLVTGDEKRDALAKLLRGDDIPARMVSPKRIVVLADHAASGEHASLRFGRIIRSVKQVAAKTAVVRRKRNQ